MPEINSYPYKIRSGVATWIIPSGLEVSKAAEFLLAARRLATDPKIKQVRVELPPTGLPLAGYQILKSVENELSLIGVHFNVSHELSPHGGRDW